MAEKNFFDILKEKMVDIRPTERHRQADWVALSARLDRSLPQHSRPPRRSLLPLLLLCVALLASNFLWWHKSREHRTEVERLKVHLVNLQTAVSSLKTAPITVRTDTVWQKVYIRMPDQEYLSAFRSHFPGVRKPDPAFSAGRTTGQLKSLNQLSETMVSPGNTYPDIPAEPAPVSAGESINRTETGGAGVVVTGGVAPLHVLKKDEADELTITTRREPFSPGSVPVFSARPFIPVRPFGSVLLHAIKPKYLKVGAVAAWLNPLNSALIHEIGFETGVQANVGFSRHWSVVLEYTLGQLHYESNDPNAILGAPAFPPLPSPAHHYEHLDLQRQPLRQFGMGLRYTFLQPGKARPYFGLQWGGQTVMPYQVEYEIRHEPSNTSETTVLAVKNATYLHNILRFGAGLEAPLFKQLHFTAEGFYLGQWKKQKRGSLNIVGLRIGTNWLF